MLTPEGKATDLSPIQVSSAPPNVRFEIDDCSSEWTYAADSFDFVHARALLGALASWPEFYRQCLKCVSTSAPNPSTLLPSHHPPTHRHRCPRMLT